MRFMLPAAILAVTIVSAGAEEARFDGIEIVDTGLYRLELGKETPDPNAPGEMMASVEKAELIESTTTVPGALGREFGLRYRVLGEPAGAEVTFDFHYTYPSPGLADPERDAPLLEERFSRQRTIGKTEFTGFGFDNPWEIVPGTWTFEISHDGKTLATQSFEVTAD